MLLPHASSSATVARERVRGDLAGCDVGAETVEDASLVVSELVGNAVRHAYPLQSGQIRLRWATDCCRTEIAVSDGGSSSVPERGSLSASTPGGKGLGIVDRLAEAWGVRRTGGVTTVWALLPCRAPVSRGRGSPEPTRPSS